MMHSSVTTLLSMELCQSPLPARDLVPAFVLVCKRKHAAHKRKLKKKNSVIRFVGEIF